MLGLAFKLLGIGKAIIGWILGIIKAIFEFCKRRPILALVIAIDIALIAGCVWGYTRHRDALEKEATITQLHKDIKEKDSLIEHLYKRLDEYVDALNVSQKRHAESIRRNNEAIVELKEKADQQLARAQAEAARSKAQRDRYFQLAEKYRRAAERYGTPEERIANEERLNDEFIKDYRGVRQ